MPTILAQTTTSTTAAGTSTGFGSLLPTLAFIVVMVGVFYFLLIRPQRNRMRRQQQLVQSMKVGDEVETIGGIFGTIEYFDEATDTVIISTEGGGRLRVARRALADRANKGTR